MRRHRSSPASPAFSLVEIVVALGLVSFALLATFGLLSVASDTSKRSRDEQSAAQLVQNEFQRIRSLSTVNFPDTLYAPRYYDASLSDLGTTISSAAIYQLQISILTPAAPSPADRIFNAEVRYPANAPASNQKIVRFTGLMNLP
jgi:uncharacterized protein (TIGR02598 family)